MPELVTFVISELTKLNVFFMISAQNGQLQQFYYVSVISAKLCYYASMFFFLSLSLSWCVGCNGPASYLVKAQCYNAPASCAVVV